MKDMQDYAYRRELTERYLAAETTAEEEQRLRSFYMRASVKPVSPDEEDFMALIRTETRQSGECCNSGFEISEEKAAEFDRIMMKRDGTTRHGIPRMRVPLTGTIFTYIASAAAVLIIAFTLLRSAESPQTPDLRDAVLIGKEAVASIVQATESAAELDRYEIQPVGNATLITIAYKDSSTSTYIVSESDGGDVLEILPVSRLTARNGI